MAQRTPNGMRLHIGIFGRKNVGKSSLLNAITKQTVSIVSSKGGTTTDPVGKPMELLPLGPVIFIDTAGIDDIGLLGQLRVKKTMEVFNRTDIGVLVAEAKQWGKYEEAILEEFATRKTPSIVVFNKTDIEFPTQLLQNELAALKITTVMTVASKGKGVDEFRKALINNAPDELSYNQPIVRDLVNPDELVIMVVPIDKEAPKGRLILPQVQTIRDLLDGDSYCMVVKEEQLEKALNQLKNPPKLVVTDSQAFKNVASITPLSIPLTSFSILFSRLKGDLMSQVKGAFAIASLKPGDKILVAEACTHHPIEGDIGRVKIPQWLSEYTRKELQFETVAGKDWPEDVSGYKLVIHCGACTFNKKAVLSRIFQCKSQGVPFTNYGLTIAFTSGILERALRPFPDSLKEYLTWKSQQ